MLLLEAVLLEFLDVQVLGLRLQVPVIGAMLEAVFGHFSFEGLALVFKAVVDLAADFDAEAHALLIEQASAGCFNSRSSEHF